MNYPKSILSIAFSVITAVAAAQVKGDDDGILSQQAAARDSMAVNNALNAVKSLKDIYLPAGEYEITVKANDITGKELMRLFELTMPPE